MLGKWQYLPSWMPNLVVRIVWHSKPHLQHPWTKGTYPFNLKPDWPFHGLSCLPFFCGGANTLNTQAVSEKIFVIRSSGLLNLFSYTVKSELHFSMRILPIFVFCFPRKLSEDKTWAYVSSSCCISLDSWRSSGGDSSPILTIKAEIQFTSHSMLRTN